MKTKKSQGMLKNMKKLAAFILTIATILGMTPSGVQKTFGLTSKVQAETTTETTTGGTSLLAAPSAKNTDDDSENEMVWNCIYFGEYPQSEVTNSKKITLLNNITEDKWVSLENPSTGTNGSMAYYVAASGTKYLRMKMGDATYATSNADHYYNWSDSQTYHYFVYEPIKWRVLSVNADGTDALLLADRSLDDQVFHPTKSTVTVNGSTLYPNKWKYSTIRSFLNGYNSSLNSYKYDYSNGYNFKSMAFSETEQSAIINTTISNSEGYYHYFDGSSTADDIFLLSYQEAAGSGNYRTYGFTSDDYRLTQNTEFCRAMGAYTNYGYNYWWLRSSGDGSYRATVTCYSGDVHKGGNNVDYNDFSVRPALHLNLNAFLSTDSSALCYYGGQVDSDGRCSSYKGTFNLNGQKTISYTDLSNHLSVPYNYEEEGYEYTYTVNNTDITSELKAGTYTITADTTISVTKTAVFKATFKLGNEETVVYADKMGNINKPANYETAGYDYSYYYNGIKILTWPFTITANTIITVQKESHNSITVYYNQSNWSQAYIHYKIGSGSWTTSPGVKMTASSEQSGYTWKYTIELGNSTNATVCFNNGSSAWDSKNGANYYLSQPGIYGIKNQSIYTLTEATPLPTTTVPSVSPFVISTIAPTETPTIAPTATPTVVPTITPTTTPVNHTITIYYKNSSWSQAYIHYKTGSNSWTTVPGIKMTESSEQSDYTWKYIISLEDATTASVCFNNGNGTWDSKNSTNYNFTQPGVYGIKNQTIYTLN